MTNRPKPEVLNQMVYHEMFCHLENGRDCFVDFPSVQRSATMIINVVSAGLPPPNSVLDTHSQCMELYESS